MRRYLLTLLFLSAAFGVNAQLKPRPDAFPPKSENLDTKAVTMAATVEEMADWDRYPTYDTYLEMMRRWTTAYPTLCHVDTIGVSVQGRLILSMYIEPPTDADLYRPEFFYSSTIHGDEVTGYVMMLRLIDTLLTSYGTDAGLTSLMDRTRISINPIANPDGTYRRGNQTIQGAQRYNADGIDLNRNFPNPFASTKAGVPQENQAMMDYFAAHQFRLSANLHGGAEVMNYPWDSFTSSQNPHPAADWWREVCQRFVDTARVYSDSHFRDVTSNGYIAGGDWYVITGGRQDYMNHTYNCLELTMEISTQKTLGSDRLPEYWHFLAPSLINYIGEIHSLPNNAGLRPAKTGSIDIHPNPTTDQVTVIGLPEGSHIELYDAYGRLVFKTREQTLYTGNLPSGLYLLRTAMGTAKMIKR
jgi:hypothetical protein